MLLVILVAMADVYFISRLGTTSLAASALVFPFQTLMAGIATGGMGGGVASTLARALGAGRLDDARAIVRHALILGIAIGFAFTAIAWTVAPSLYSAMGGDGLILKEAVMYSHVWFTGAVLFWTNTFMGSLLRGSGDAATPSRYAVVTLIAYVPLAGVLALGVGAWAGLGLIGLPIASLATTGGGCFLLARSLLRSSLGLTSAVGIRLQGKPFVEILRVGALGSFTTLTGSVTGVVMTGFVGGFGGAALAGYNIGARLEQMLPALAFGIGASLTTLVGVAAGAGAWRRANKVAWTGALMAFSLIGVIGWTVALLPEAWSRIFTTDAVVINAAAAYLTHVAPVYCLLGLGIALNFAGQGAARMAVPIAAGVSRMVVTIVGGWFAIRVGLGLGGVFTAIAAGITVYGCYNSVALLAAPWRAMRATTA